MHDYNQKYILQLVAALKIHLNLSMEINLSIKSNEPFIFMELRSVIVAVWLISF